MILPAEYSLIAVYSILIKDIQMQIINEMNNYRVITIHQEHLLFYFTCYLKSIKNEKLWSRTGQKYHNHIFN